MELSRIRILLIEDNLIDVDILQEELSQIRNGIEISFEHVERLKTAIAYIKEQRFDVVLADLSLPDAQGLDTVKQIHAVNPDLPIVVMTGLDDEAFAMESVRQGAQDYLVKGQINHHILLRTIRYAIERLQTQKLLRESLEKFRSLLETTSDCVWEMNAQYIYTYVSPRIQDTLGYTPDEVIGKNFFDFMPPNEAERVQNDIGNQPFQYLENTKIHKHNYQVNIESNGTPFFSSDGVLLGYRGVDRDITARKRSEALLRKSEKRLRAILDNATAIIYICDLEGKFILVNRQYEKIFKINKEEIENRTIHDIFPKEIADIFLANNQVVLDSLEPINVEEVAPHENGLSTYVSVKFPLFDENNQPYAVCSISTDITDRRQAEEEIRRALEKERELSELRSEFISTVSHEFRTPLSSILLCTDLLISKIEECPTEKTQIRLQRIKQAVKRMTDLLEDVLTVSKAESGKLDFNPTLLNVKDFCWQVIEELQNSFTDKHIFQFRSSCLVDSYNSSSNNKSDIPLVHLDEKLLRHILTNLLFNSVKYSPNGGLISLELIYASRKHFPITEDDGDNIVNSKADRVVVFKIKDQGIGILPEDKARLFESFHRGKNIGTISGTGLGLVIVKRSVDVQGGKIFVESEVGTGSTFTVILPVH